MGLEMIAYTGLGWRNEVSVYFETRGFSVGMYYDGLRIVLEWGEEWAAAVGGVVR